MSLAAFVGLAALTATPTVAAPFLNGDFESPSLTAPNRTFYASVPTGWTAPSRNGLAWNATIAQQRGDPDVRAASGKQFVSLQYGGGLGSVSQTFDTEPGRTYQVAFDLSAVTAYQSGSNPPQTFRLRANAPGVAKDFSIMTAGLPFDGNGIGTDPWTHQTFTFLAAAPSSTLTFANHTLYARHRDLGTSLDNVTVQALSVPEPAAALPIMATAFLLLARRRRQSMPEVA